VQESTQHFTGGLIKPSLDRFWSTGFLLKTRHTSLLKGMNRVAHGLRRTTHIVGNFFGTLSSTGGKQDLTPTQGKGI
jgi:hypothetical protein